MKRWKYLLPALAAAAGLTGAGLGDGLLLQAQDWLETAPERLTEASRQICGEGALPFFSASGTERQLSAGETDAEPGDFLQGRRAIGLAPENDAALLAAQEGYYAFGCLTEEEQLLYVDIVQILRSMAHDVEIRLPGDADGDLSVLGRVFQCVMDDHPEFFYADGYTYVKYTEGSALEEAGEGGEGRLIRVTLSGSYTMSPARRERCEEQIARCVEEARAALPEDATEYETVREMYEYVIQNTDYRLASRENQNICSVFLYGESVCQGYARALQYLLQQSGVQTCLVTGTVQENESHVWDLVRIDGQYYYVDPTWGDASYRPDGQTAQAAVEGDRQDPPVNYDYLCVTTEQLCRTHTPRSVVPLPVCDAVEANYYRMEQAYFTGYDREGIRALFDKAYDRGDPVVTVKCSSAQSYEEVRRMLLDAQEVFDYLRGGDGRVVYTDSREEYRISFWL